MRNDLKKKVLVLVCPMALLTGATVAAAQAAPQTPTPSVDQILDKYVQALGGKAAYAKLTSRVSKGTFELDQMPGEATQETREKAPNKQLSVTESPQFVVKRGFNGTTGWEDTPQTGLRDVTGEQLASMKRFADFYFPLNLKESYPKMVVKGKESVNGHPAYVLEATPSGGSAELMYFDVDSGLILRHQAQVETANGKADID